MSDVWTQVALTELVHQRRDAVKIESGCEYPLLGVRWYGEGPFHRETVTRETSKATTIYRVEPGQFIYNRLFAGKGSFGLVLPELAGSFVSIEFPLFDIDTQRLSAEYLNLYFQQRRVWDYVETVSTGTTASRNRWKESQFLAHHIPLPALSVQQRIVEVIDAVDDQITALKAQVEALVTVRTGLVGRSADTKQVPLGSLGVVSQGKGLPKEHQGKRTGEVSWYKIADMTGPGNEFGYTVADTRLTPAEVAEIGGVVVDVGAVTFPRVGAAILTEKKRIMDTPGALDENHLVITPGQETNSEYLLAVLESFALTDLVRSGAVPSLNSSMIRSTKVPWSWTENQSLGTALGALRAESRALAAEAASLRTTRAALLSGLLDRTVDIKSAELEF